ncbi:MAG: hypothetical protein AABY83_00605 [Pseudomonadota bacterium]
MRTIKTMAYAAVLAATGCAGSMVAERHSLYPTQADTDYARVYIMRPQAQRTRGVADSPVNIEVAREKLAELAQGEYILVYIKSPATDLVTRNLTNLTTKPMPIEVWRARHFNFETGQDYFIVLRQDYEEFRGIYYIPEAVDKTQALQLAEHLKAAGPLATQRPLAALQ